VSARNVGGWGELALVVDTSAWVRLRHPDVVGLWEEAVRSGRLRITPPVRLELLFAARDGNELDAIADGLSLHAAAPLTASALRAAEAAMRALAHRSAGAQRMPLIDYLVAAAAQESGGAVLHYDRDYDTLAEVMSFESIWLAPAGSIP
jgi:hypothetical protein